jgi:hypothetical protein
MCLFGDVNDKKLKLNDAGKMIARIFTNLTKYYKGATSDTYIVMPDHFHGIITIDSPVGAGLRTRPNNHIHDGDVQPNLKIICFYDKRKFQNKYIL